MLRCIKTLPPTTIARAVSTLVLGPTGNVQGSYKFNNLDTGRQLVANQFITLPMPHEVIVGVHLIADAQCMPANLIFTDAKGKVMMMAMTFLLLPMPMRTTGLWILLIP